jgi:inorganic pyrophosphatase
MPTFWDRLETLLAQHEIIIDRPQGTAHPRFPTLIYPLDYGYLADTSASDGIAVDL